MKNKRLKELQRLVSGFEWEAGVYWGVWGLDLMVRIRGSSKTRQKNYENAKKLIWAQ